MANLRESLNSLASTFHGSGLKQLEVTIGRTHQNELTVNLHLTAEHAGKDGHQPVQFKASGAGKTVADALTKAAEAAKIQGAVCAAVSVVTG